MSSDSRSSSGYDPSSRVTPSESWLFAQAILGKPLLPIVGAAAMAKAEREELKRLADFSIRHADELNKLNGIEAAALHEHQVLEWAAQVSSRAEEKLRVLQQSQPSALHSKGLTNIIEWNPNQPRVPAGSPQGGQWTQGVGTFSGGTLSGGTNAGVGNESPPSSDSDTGARPAVNADGVQIAGAGPEPPQSYKDKVQKSLDTLDPKIARWWKANSVSGVVRSRAAGWWQTKSRSWLDQNGRPVVEVDQDFTAGETAQAIIDEVKGGWFADSIGVFYKKYTFARSGDVDEFRKWQQGATAEAAHLASVLAELYISSIATLTPAGDLTVAVGDVADNGPRWDQLLSILPYVGHLPVAAIVVKFGKYEARIPKALARKLDLLTKEEQKTIKAAISTAKTDQEAAAIMKREIARIAGKRQIHHPISKVVHDALEEHRLLKGKYQYRDQRFEALAIDLKSHQGYEEWHRAVDRQVAAWLKQNADATEAKFEAWLRWRYSEPDLKTRFPKAF